MADFVVFRNPKDHPVSLACLELPEVPAQGTVEIPVEYAAPFRKDNGTRGKSTIELVAPQLEPADPKIREIWLKVPETGQPASRLARTVIHQPAESPGVKALREAQSKKLKG